MFELDIFVGELTFSLSDRQLQMITQLLKIASSKPDPPSANRKQALVTPFLSNVASENAPVENVTPFQLSAARPGEAQTLTSQVQDSKASSGKDSWLGWAMNALGGSENDEEDDLESEIIAETREALKRVNAALAAEAATKAAFKEGPVSVVSCLRLCIRTVSLTLRKHPNESQAEMKEADDDSAAAADTTEELVPVANLGLVRVPVQTTKSRVSRPATPLCMLRLHYVALEGIFVQGEERKSDLVFEIERVELLSIGSDGQNISDGKQAGDCPIFEWGSVDAAAFTNCVSHPYFINSFYGEESRHLNRRETRSFELVKVSFDTEIPVWKTLESKHASEQEFDFQKPCECSTVWKGTRYPCTPTSTLYRVCQDVTRSIGLKERTLDGASLLLLLARSSKAHAVVIQAFERLQEILKEVAAEYLHLRSPDLGATENLQQLLQPQLFALLARQTLHTCGAEMLSSSCRSTDIRRRSVHSAVRLRLASSKNAQKGVEFKRVRATAAENGDFKRGSRVLDVSLGQVDASFDPVHYTGVIELVSTFVSDVLKKDEKMENGEAGETSSEEALQTQRRLVELDSTQSADDIVLITFSKLHLQVSNDQKHIASLSTLVCDAVYSGSNCDGTFVRRSLTVGELSARCTPPRSLQFAESAFQVIGLECAVTDQVKGGGGEEDDRMTNSFLAVDKVTATMNDESMLRGCVAVDGLLRALGINSFLQDPIFNFPLLARVFRLDVFGVRASLSQATTSRLKSLNKRALDVEIGSLSLTSSSQRDPERISVGFYSGTSPFANENIQRDETQPFVALSLREEKSPGASCFAPFPTFFMSEIDSTDEKHIPVYRLHFAAKVAEFEANLKGLSNAATVVLRLQYSLAENWRFRFREENHEKSSPLLENVPRNADAAVSAPWEIAGTFSSHAGLVRLNEFVEVSVPPVTVASLEESPRVNPATPGGAVRLEWNCGDLKVSMVPSSDKRSLAEKQILILQGLRGHLAYVHQVGRNLHHHVVDGEVHVSRVCVELSRLTVRLML